MSESRGMRENKNISKSKSIARISKSDIRQEC